MFQSLLARLKHDTVSFLVRLEVRRDDEAAVLERQRLAEESRQRLAFHHQEISALAETGDAGTDQAAAPQPFTREMPKVGRNEACPCGSGKKFKQCHGRLG